MQLQKRSGKNPPTHMPTNSPSCLGARSCRGCLAVLRSLYSASRGIRSRTETEDTVELRSNIARVLTWKGAVEHSSTGPAQRDGTVESQCGVCVDARTLQRAIRLQVNLVWGAAA